MWTKLCSDCSQYVFADEVLCSDCVDQRRVQQLRTMDAFSLWWNRASRRLKEMEAQEERSANDHAG